MPINAKLKRVITKKKLEELTCIKKATNLLQNAIYRKKYLIHIYLYIYNPMQHLKNDKEASARIYHQISHVTSFI